MSYGKTTIVDVSLDKTFSNNVAQILNIKPHDVRVEHFPDTDVHVTIEDTVRGRDVYLFQRYDAPVSQAWSTLIHAAYACQQGGKARRIIAVTPYCFGSRGERATRSRESVPIVKVVKETAAAGIDTVVAMGLHAEGIPTNFQIADVGFEHLPFEILAANYTIRKRKELGIKQIAIGSPDLGGSKRLEPLADIIHDIEPRILGELVIGHKKRNGIASTQHQGYLGNVKGQHVILYDDIGDTLGTIEGTVNSLLKDEVEAIYILCIHPSLGTPIDTKKEGYKERLARLHSHERVREIVFSNTIPLKQNALEFEKVRIIPVEPYFAEAIRRLNADESMSQLRKYEEVMKLYDTCPIIFDDKHVKIGTN